VFDLFAQGETSASQPGLGIGLALARRLVELHAGRLDVRSEGAGRGSEFVLELPLTGPTWSLPPRGAPMNAGSIDAF
jgi:signal transduction histidine kinase